MHFRFILLLPLFASVLIPVSTFDYPIKSLSRQFINTKFLRDVSWHTKARHSYTGLLSLRAQQLDKTTAVGWIGRPASVVSNVEEKKTTAEIRMSMTGDLKLQGESIKCASID